jgi:uncharacterized protein
MSLKKTALLVVLVMLAASVIGCTTSPPDDTVPISIATGSLAGTYYPLGAALAQVFNDNIEGVSAQAESTGASLANITLLMDEDVELALIQNDIAYYAFNGTEMYAESGAQDKIRGVAVWYPEIIQIVASADSGITSIEDLRGKKVAVGAPGSGTEANARQILAAHGITYDDLEKADFLTFTEAAENLKDGHVDAAFQTAGIPTAAITDIATTKNIVIVPFDDDKMTSFLAEYPFYTRVIIPAGTYPNQSEAIITVAVMAMLATHEGVDEDLVYDMVKAMFENLDTIIAAHARGADLKLETALEGMPIELHPGAARYYNE